MYIVFDAVTATYVGPFESAHEAQYYIDELGTCLEGGSAGMSIDELVQPQEFYMDNVADFAMAEA